MATRAPFSASLSAIPRPIPREAPVTSACLPFSDMVFSLSMAAAITRATSSGVCTESFRPVLTRSTTPRSAPRLARESLTMNVNGRSGAVIVFPPQLSHTGRSRSVVAGVKSRVKRCYRLHAAGGMAQLKLTLLGGFRARLDPGSSLVLPTRKAQALLAYLALPLGRAHPREKLAALLWGGIREPSARASLRQALFSIRRTLAGAERTLRQEGATIALDVATVDVDAAAFEAAMIEGTPQAIERAATLYQGDLLSGFALGEPPFEEWLLAERERLRELAVEGLAKLLVHQRK